MKTIKTKKISAELFSDIYEFLDVIEKRELNRVFAGMSERCTAKGDPDANWFGTKDWQESVDLMAKGYVVGVRKIKDAKVEVNKEGVSVKRELGLAGFAPHVPNTLRGVPFNMISQKRAVVPIKEINIFFERGAHQRVSADTMAKNARLLLDVINELETHGVKVGLYAGLAITKQHYSSKNGYTYNTFSTFVKIKDPKQPINLMKVAYPLVHPSFFRRQCLHWMETSPVVTDAKLRKGHGNELGAQFSKLQDRRDFMVENGIIGEHDAYFDFRGIESEDLNTSAKILEAIHKQLDKKTRKTA